MFYKTSFPLDSKDVLLNVALKAIMKYGEICVSKFLISFPFVALYNPF